MSVNYFTFFRWLSFSIHHIHMYNIRHQIRQNIYLEQCQWGNNPIWGQIFQFSYFAPESIITTMINGYQVGIFSNFDNQFAHY